MRVRDGSHVAIGMNYGGASSLSLSINPETDITPQELKRSNFFPTMDNVHFVLSSWNHPSPEQVQGTRLKQRIAHRMEKIHTALLMKKILIKAL